MQLGVQSSFPWIRIAIAELTRALSRNFQPMYGREEVIVRKNTRVRMCRMYSAATIPEGDTVYQNHNRTRTRYFAER